MGTKRQEELKKIIFEETKPTKTTADLTPDLDLDLMTAMGIKFKKDESKDYYRKTSKEIQMLKEEQLKEDHLVTRREKIAFITAMMEKITDDEVDALYKHIEEFVGDGGVSGNLK